MIFKSFATLESVIFISEIQSRRVCKASKLGFDFKSKPYLVAPIRPCDVEGLRISSRSVVVASDSAALAGRGGAPKGLTSSWKFDAYDRCFSTRLVLI